MYLYLLSACHPQCIVVLSIEAFRTMTSLRDREKDELRCRVSPERLRKALLARQRGADLIVTESVT